MTRASGILFCGGGTGGHVLPGLAVAAACRERGIGPQRWIGDPDRLEAKLVPPAGIELLPLGLDRPCIRRPVWWLGALAKAWGVWRELSARPPRIVVALGGYAALLPGILAPFARRPLVVLEQNALPGRTNRLLARFAKVVVTQFPEASRRLPAGKVHLLGNPVRPLLSRERGQGPAFRVLVMGGSLAAKSLNDLVLQAAPFLRKIPGLCLVHLAGEAEKDRVAAAYAEVGITAEVHGFVDDMATLYEDIDLALCRAGATTVAELCVAGIGAAYVPLPWAAEDHQTHNARAVARVGGAIVLPQGEVDGAGLGRLLTRLAGDRNLVRQLGVQARRLARPEAAAKVAELVGQYTGEPTAPGKQSP